MAEKLTGKVAKFKGKFGFISSGDEEIFFLPNAILGSAKISEGDDVLFVKEEIPEDERRKPDQKWKAVEIEPVRGKGETEPHKDKSPKQDKVAKSLAWKIYPMGKVDDRVYRVHGNDYIFHLKTEDKSIPPLWLTNSVPMDFVDAETGEEIKKDSLGKLTIGKSEILMKISMVLAFRGVINFKSPGTQDQQWILMFK